MFIDLLLIFIDFLLNFIDLHWFALMFNNFLLNFNDSDWFSFDVHTFALISYRCSLILIDFHRFPIEFHWYQISFYWFPLNSIDFLLIFKISMDFLLIFLWTFLRTCPGSIARTIFPMCRNSKRIPSLSTGVCERLVALMGTYFQSHSQSIAVDCWHSSCMRAVLGLYSSCMRAVLGLYSGCIRAVFELYSNIRCVFQLHLKGAHIISNLQELKLNLLLNEAICQPHWWIALFNKYV